MAALDIPAEALDAYVAARARAVYVREEWETAGCPTVIEYTNGLEGVHPLLKVLQDAEAHADRLMKSLSHKQARAGRPAGTQSAPDRRSAAKLKVVGS